MRAEAVSASGPVPRCVGRRHPSLYAEEQAQNGGEQGGQGAYQSRDHERDARKAPITAAIPEAYTRPSRSAERFFAR